jgi:hypothetical protein
MPSIVGTTGTILVFTAPQSFISKGAQFWAPRDHLGVYSTAIFISKGAQFWAPRDHLGVYSTTIHGMHLVGRSVGRHKIISESKEIAQDIKK